MQQYSGTLSLDDIAEGYNLAARNARRLAGDAEYLLENERYLSAVTLAVLAIEEEGKTGLFTVLALADNEAERKEFWRNYRRHTAKNRHLSFLRAMTHEKGVLTATGEALASDAEARSIDNLKQLTTYTDCLRQKEWHSPEIIPKEYQKQLATGLVLICRSLPFREISLAELEIIVKHLAKVKGASRELVEHGLVQCLKEIQETSGFARKYDDGVLIELICGK